MLSSEESVSGWSERSEDEACLSAVIDIHPKGLVVLVAPPLYGNANEEEKLPGE